MGKMGEKLRKAIIGKSKETNGMRGGAKDRKENKYFALRYDSCEIGFAKTFLMILFNLALRLRFLKIAAFSYNRKNKF